MNVSSSQRALWAIALGSVLSLGAAGQASARENPREHAGERAREDDKRAKTAADKHAAPVQRRQAMGQGPAARQAEPRTQRMQGDDARRAPAVTQRPQASSRTQALRPPASQHVPQGTQRQAQRPDPARLAQQRNAQAEAMRASSAARRDAERRQQAQQAQRRTTEMRVANSDDDRRQQAAQARTRQWPQPRVDNRADDRRHQVDRDQRERRIREERQRAERYRQAQAHRYQVAVQRGRLLEQQRRMAQYRYEQQYLQRLRQQQLAWQARSYDPYQDQYYLTPASYRYAYGGGYRETNRYGADLMRQAVNYGYREGVNAGRADREDGWRNDYRSSYGYQDASYGYNGYYVDQDVYNHYFRQGFERGYDDGYGSRYRYGQRDNGGNYAILGTVLAVILGLQLIG